MTRTHTVALSIVAAVTLAACGGNGSGDAASPSSGTSSRPSSPARLSIEAPKAGHVVHGSTVQLRVDLEGARLVPATTTDIVPDEGHLHVILDDSLISMTEGLHQSIPNLSPGMHRLTVEFVASDHAPFDPRVVAVTEFEVQP